MTIFICSDVPAFGALRISHSEFRRPRKQEGRASDEKAMVVRRFACRCQLEYRRDVVGPQLKPHQILRVRIYPKHSTVSNAGLAGGCRDLIPAQNPDVKRESRG